MISYCGVGLPNQTQQLQQWLDNFLPLDSVTDAEFNYWVGLEALPTPPVPPSVKPRLGVLSWPQHASRPATAHFVINSAKLAEVRTAVGDPATAQNLVFDDEVNDPVTASMYFVSARPLMRCGGTDEELFLLTLADIRWKWQFKSASITDPTSWSNLFTQIGTALGTTVTPDTIHAYFLTPTDRWISAYRYLPAVLDAAAAAVGQKVVVSLDGSVVTQNYDTALTGSTTQYALYSKTAGGLFASEDLKRVVPAAVRTLFRTSAGAVPHTVDTTLASLALTGYGSSTGVAGLTAAVLGDHDYTGTGSNPTDCANFANKLSEAWYGWRLADLDVQWAGLVPWTPLGCDYLVEWSHTDTLLGTRVQREPHNWQQAGDVDYGECCGWRADFPTREWTNPILVGHNGPLFTLPQITSVLGSVPQVRYINLPHTRITVPAEAGELFAGVGVNLVNYGLTWATSGSASQAGTVWFVVRGALVVGPAYAPNSIGGRVRIASGHIKYFYDGNYEIYGDQDYEVDHGGRPFGLASGSLGGKPVWSGHKVYSPLFFDNRGGTEFDVQWQIEVLWGMSSAAVASWDVKVGVTLGRKTVGSLGMTNGPTGIVWRKVCCPDDYDSTWYPGPYPILGERPRPIFIDPADSPDEIPRFLPIDDAPQLSTYPGVGTGITSPGTDEA